MSQVASEAKQTDNGSGTKIRSGFTVSLTSCSFSSASRDEAGQRRKRRSSSARRGVRVRLAATEAAASEAPGEGR